MDTKKKTVFIDIDGTILKYTKGGLSKFITNKPEILPNVLEKFTEWRDKGYYIVLTTARTMGMRTITEQQLAQCGVFYDQLIMGLLTGPRVLINDDHPIYGNMAEAISLKRDSGLADINI